MSTLLVEQLQNERSEDPSGPLSLYSLAVVLTGLYPFAREALVMVA